MTIMGLLILLLVAGISGAIGQAIAGYSHGGCIVSIALGFIGALLGGWLADWMGLPAVFVIHIGGQAFPVLWAVIGSALFVAFLGLLTRGR